MRPFVFTSRFTPRVTFAAALLTIVVGCYGTPQTGRHDGGASARGGTGGTGDSIGGAGSTGSGGSSGAAGSSGTGGAIGGSTAGSATGGSSGAAGRGGSSGGLGGRGGAGGSDAGARGGAGGSGGTAGSGGTNPGKALGQNCGVDQDCNSVHCANGICCDQACTGPCKRCSASGVCQMPPDDSACGTINCPADSVCRDYATSISTNRCKAIGQCKTLAECSYVNAPATQYCGVVHGMSEIASAACDGMGACVGPVVRCGGDGDCALVNNMNCCGGPGSGLMCQATDCNPNQGPFYCDETADCAPGLICCAYLTPTPGVGSNCTAASNCVSDGPTVRQQVCNPSASPTECAAGTCQLGDSVTAPPGFYVCK